MQLGDSLTRPRRVRHPARCGYRSWDVREGPQAARCDTGGDRRGAARRRPGREYLSNAGKESREQCVARMTAAVRVVFAGFGATATGTPCQTITGDRCCASRTTSTAFRPSGWTSRPRCGASRRSWRAACRPTSSSRAVAGRSARLLGADPAATIRYEPGDMVTPSATGRRTACTRPVAGAGRSRRETRARILQDAPPRADRRLEATFQGRSPTSSGRARAVAPRSEARSSSRAASGATWPCTPPRGPLPPDTEERLTRFTELVATAILNAQARAEVQRLADEQAALRRVATLVARERPPDARSSPRSPRRSGDCCPSRTPRCSATRRTGSATFVASWGAPDAAILVGTQMPLEGKNVTVAGPPHGTAGPHRRLRDGDGPLGDHMRELGIRRRSGRPIIVDGRSLGRDDRRHAAPEPLPAGHRAADREVHRAVATAISNVQARADLAASRARIVAAADEERRRVVRDLHDGAQQRLVTPSSP